MYDPADHIADLRTAVNAWHGEYFDTVTMDLLDELEPGQVGPIGFVFEIHDEENQRDQTIATAHGHVVRCPESYRNLIDTIHSDGLATDFGVAVNDLSTDGLDRAELLIAGATDADVAYVEVSIPVNAAKVAGPVLADLITNLSDDQDTLILTRPAWWAIGDRDVAIRTAEQAGFEQWGNTAVWTYYATADDVEGDTEDGAA